MKAKLWILLLVALLVFAAAACGDDDDDDNDDTTSDGDDDDNDTAGDDDDTAVDPGDDDDDGPVTTLQVGAARVDISPTEPVKMGGYGTYFLSEDLCRWSEGVHDPIYATAMAFQDGDGEPVIHIVLDTVGVIITDTVIIQEELAAGIGTTPERIIVSATHNHASPDTVGIWGVMAPPVTGRDDVFIEDMIAGAIAAGRQAYDSRRPALAYAAHGQYADTHYNSQNEVDPAAPLDSNLTVLIFLEPDRTPIGTLTNWACHPMVMGPGNAQISSDFLGPYYRYLDNELGGVNMYVSGNLGAGVHPQNDEHPIEYTGRTWGSWPLLEFYGRKLGDAVLTLYDEGSLIEDTSISLTTREVAGELRNPFFALAGSLGLIPREIPPLGGVGITTMTAWRLGPISFATAPGEVSPRVGLRLRQVMDGQYKVMTNIGQDWLGYIMTKDEYQSILYIYFAILSVGPKMEESITGAYQQVFSSF